MIIFSVGVLESATAILGALAGGVPMPAWSVALAGGAIVIVFAFLLTQVRMLARFYRSHRARCWVSNDPPTGSDEVDDPLLALLSRLRILRPRQREQGAWVLPEKAAAEPQRTELDLAEAFNCGLGFRQTVARCCFGRAQGFYARRRTGPPDTCEGDDEVLDGERELERLQLWTRDGSASRAGAAFGLVVVMAQLGISINTGFFFVHPWARTTAGQAMRLGVNAALQAGCALFAAGPAANDVLNGCGVATVFALECTATLCLLASVVVMDAQPVASVSVLSNESSANVVANVYGLDSNVGAGLTNATAAAGDEQLARIAAALQLATVSASLLSASIFVPLALTCYDGLVVPIIVYVRKQDAGTPREIACAMLVSVVVLPIQLAKSFLGINAEIADIVSEFTDASKEVTTGATASVEDVVEEYAAVSKDRVKPSVTLTDL